MTASPPLRLPAALRALFRPLLDPYRRYRHAKLIHAARVALSVLVSIALSTGLNIPHGEWSSITVLIVIGGLQHHGNIRKKAAERALGTTIGAAAGLALIVLQSTLHVSIVTYLVMSVLCGLCAYYAIGKAGYVALLSAITILIVAGHGDNEIVDGLWRAVNVIVGIGIALAFSFALPLYATYSWRYKLADSLRACAVVHARIVSAQTVSDTAHLKEMAALNALLVQMRSLMPWVSKETDITMAQLDAIQRSLRLVISSLEMLASVQPADGDVAGRHYVQTAQRPLNRRIHGLLIGPSRALKFGTLARLQPLPAVRAPADGEAPAQLSGFVSINDKIARECDVMRQRVQDVAAQWCI
ncbi:FUSC family protein [Burkholderia sp. Ac-20379]|uniref:FUSC family protein n=1 Tax=Burkholderia sp. Ac-20379 TaxID=2703900 RepID=UPI00197F2D92|nr:FUSC family protein [Burkholderia sp. Ac-20379]MBN3724052.1 FUSC family protein [Burkholderia sp. Ac-20379]